MRTSIWYRSEEKNPDKSGYYLSFRGFGMGGTGDGDHSHGYMYYNKKTDQWYEYDNSRTTAFVYYWTDAEPELWTDQDPPSIKIKKQEQHLHVAVQDAWKEVQEAIKRYETMKALCAKP